MVLLLRNLTSSKHIGPLHTVRFTIIFKFYPLLLLNFIIIIFDLEKDIWHLHNTEVRGGRKRHKGKSK